MGDIPLVSNTLTGNLNLFNLTMFGAVILHISGQVKRGVAL